MNRRSPTEVLSSEESAQLRDLARLRGEKAAIELVGLRSPKAFYKAAAELPVATLTAEVIRARLGRL